MGTFERRIKRLEQIRAEESHLIVLVAMNAGAEFALSTEQCVTILRDAGAQLSSGVCLIDLVDAPMDLTAAELEQYLRDHAADIAGTNIP